MKRNVVFLVAPPFELLDLTGPYSVFSEANVASGRSEYVLQIVSTTRDQSLKSTAGLSVTSQHYYQDFTKSIDTLLVVGGRGAMRPYDKDVLRWMRTGQERIRRIGSVCTGAFLLAATGLLDGRKATTHWQNCDQLSREYPNIQVKGLASRTISTTSESGSEFAVSDTRGSDPLREDPDVLLRQVASTNPDRFC